MTQCGTELAFAAAAPMTAFRARRFDHVNLNLLSDWIGLDYCMSGPQSATVAFGWIFFMLLFFVARAHYVPVARWRRGVRIFHTDRPRV